ncbi:peptide-binding protein [Hyphomicrobium nitrativorans NL23]|uniref:Peptide-binding protein n=1 Tax=Hyphomicrobium nitrativorans NL23 TaxID=1029756 RepID=V5S8S1_9HYPH|nr:hypothetical protein [Hyphomicrobium nitrativorans]AHB47156.1 peptide-binding protein [Hyphomicrobium nitrativorans NL23]
MRDPFVGRALGLVLATCLGSNFAGHSVRADDRPRFWAVTGVAPGDVLNLRDVPHGDSKKLAGIPPDTRGLKHLGCLTPEPSLDRWMIMTESERINAKLQWCRVEYRGMQGWVAARFLKPDP